MQNNDDTYKRDPAESDAGWIPTKHFILVLIKTLF